MTDEIYSGLSQKIDILIHLIAFQITDGMTIKDAAPLLNRLGMESSAIAIVLDSTTNTVTTRISEAKRNPK